MYKRVETGKQEFILPDSYPYTLRQNAYPMLTRTLGYWFTCKARLSIFYFFFLFLTDFCKGFRSYHCKIARMCIWYDQICDGKADCPTSEDEDDSCIVKNKRRIEDSNILI